MKVTFGRIFEQTLIAKTKSSEELQPFIEWVQTAIDNVARALTSQLTLSDNVDSAFYTQKFKGSTTTIVQEFKVTKTPKALLIAQQTPISPAVESYAWQMLANGNAQVSIKFSAAPTTGVDVSFLAFHS